MSKLLDFLKITVILVGVGGIGTGLWFIADLTFYSNWSQICQRGENNHWPQQDIKEKCIELFPESAAEKGLK